jgi:hypothetical protein
MANLKSAQGTRSEPPVEPRVNGTLSGVICFGVIEKGLPVKYYLGRRSCTMFAVGAVRGGLITIERFFGP